MQEHLEQRRDRRENERSRKKKNIRIALSILLVVCIAVFCYAAYQIYDILNEWSEGNTSYRDVKKQYVSDELSAQDSEINFVDLQTDYPEAMSWIRIEGTRIDYPVAQGKDNQYYVTHLIDGTRNKNGAIFIDYRNSADLSDKNTIFYGHHMKSGAMFAGLVDYKDIAFYREHPIVELFLPEGNYIGEIYSAYITPADSSTFTPKFKNNKKFAEYLEMTMKKSLIDTGIKVTAEDRIVTLSTCTYEYDDARFVVHARLKPVE